ILAGKAHPADNGGKRLIQEIIGFCQEIDVRGRVVFLEDYDMATAAAMVQGVDVWLNNPRRPLEASGTSGMKVLPNGGLNLSVLDGWWAEAFTPEVGWAIGNGEEYQDTNYGDGVEADLLYRALESEIIPLYYDRQDGGLPHGWIAKMKRSMTELCYRFNTNRMVHDYAENHYVPAAQHRRALSADNYRRAKALGEWSGRVRQAWNRVRILRVDRQRSATGIEFIALVNLNGLQAEEVRVEVYRDRSLPDYPAPGVWTLQPVKGTQDKTFPALFAGTDAVCFVGAVPDENLPGQNYTVRLLPYHPDATLPISLPLIVWEK
nr:alpha-glucan family phosphorylase [Armatimonadota bacterium]